MKAFIKVLPMILISALVSFSCSSGDEPGDDPGKATVPGKAVLLFPYNNTECIEGRILSDTETEVTFEWEDAANATSYELIVTNLADGSSKTLKTNRNMFPARLLRATPYTWKVRSKNANSNLTADSEPWKFYNAGLPGESHPPFPAEVVSPKMGATVEGTTVTLSWESSDIDNDIVSYSIFAGSQSPPETMVSETSVKNVLIPITSGNVYYWKVVTTDALGNASDSPVFQFYAK